MHHAGFLITTIRNKRALDTYAMTITKRMSKINLITADSPKFPSYTNSGNEQFASGDK